MVAARKPARAKAKSTAKRKPAAKKPARKTAAKKPARKATARKSTATRSRAKSTSRSKAKAKAPARARTSARAKAGDDYQSFSGKFTVRLPKSLHQALVQRAEKEGVSLNLFVTNALSRTVAMPSKKR